MEFYAAGFNGRRSTFSSAQAIGIPLYGQAHSI